MLPCTGSKVIRTHLNYKTINRARTDGMACSGMSLGHFEHDDVIKWKYFPHNWPFVRGIHRSPVNSPYKGQWRGALMFSLICVWINDWENNREAWDLRRYCAHYDVIVMDGLYTADIFLFFIFLSAPLIVYCPLNLHYTWLLDTTENHLQRLMLMDICLRKRKVFEAHSIELNMSGSWSSLFSVSLFIKVITMFDLPIYIIIVILLWYFYLTKYIYQHVSYVIDALVNCQSPSL